MSVLAILHPTNLLAAELRETLGRRPDLWREILLLSDNAEEVGSLTEIGGGAAMVQALEADSLDRVDVAFFCAPIETSRPLIAALGASTAAVVLSPEAAVDDGHPVVGGINLETADRSRPLLSPHPGTVALAHLLQPLKSFVPRRAVATLLQPVSVCGKAGLDEMFQQTRAILAFSSEQPREVFPHQMAFNVVPAEASQTALVSHLQTVLDSDLEVSAQVLQAGVFHSFGISLHVELDDDPGAEEVAQALAEHPVNELVEQPQVLGPIDAAARGKVLVGPVEPARPGYNVWAVMDNLTRGGALNAVEILEAIGHPVVTN